MSSPNTPLTAQAVAIEKAALRTRFQAYRTNLGKAEYAARSTAIVERVRALPELSQAATIHAYWPLEERHEIDTRPLIAWLQASGKQIVLPVVVTFSRTASSQPRLRHVRFAGAGALRPNRWGIHEPLGETSVSTEEIDAVIVPTLGAGRNGHRLGHGFGYYDEFLRQVQAPTIGLVYAACLVQTIPPAAHDVPLSILVTEEETLRPGTAVTS